MVDLGKPCTNDELAMKTIAVRTSRQNSLATCEEKYLWFAAILAKFELGLAPMTLDIDMTCHRNLVTVGRPPDAISAAI